MPPPSAPLHRRAVSALFLANGFTMGAFAPQIPAMMLRLKITESVLGLLIFALGIGAVGAMFFSGTLIARYGSRRVVLLFSVLIIPALPLIVLAPNIALVATAMAAMGGCIGTMDVAMNANAVAVERQLGRAIMSSCHGFWSLGGFVGGSLGSFGIKYGGALGQAIGVALLVTALVLWSAPRIFNEPVPVTEPLDSNQKKQPHVARDLSLWILGGMALSSMIPEGAVLDWGAIYLGKELKAGVIEAGMGYAFFAGSMAMMRFAGDHLRNRLGAVRTLRLSGLIAATALAFAAAAPQAWLGVAGFAIAGIGIANMVPILFSAAGNHPSLPAGVAISTVTMLGYAGILIAPATIGFVASHAGFRATYAALALLLLVVVAMANRASDADRLRRL